METNDLGALRLQAMEQLVQHQAREIRALERIEGLLDRSRELEVKNGRLERTVEQVRTLWSLSQTLSATLDMVEIFRQAGHLISRALPVDAYALMLVDEEGSRLTIEVAFGLSEECARGFSLGMGEGISGLVVQTGQPMRVPEVAAEPRFAERACFPREGTFLAVPMRTKRDKVIGVLSAHKLESQGFSSGDMELFQAVATQIATALENARLYQRTRELAAKDDLTGLFNRRYFFEMLESEVQRARRYRRAFTLAMLDLDHFKHYNDTHGHLRGDDALREVGRLLLRNTRRADVVARFGGEEFMILLPEIAKDAGTLVAEKIRSAVEQYPFYGRQQQPGGMLMVTVGLAAYPVDSEGGVELVELADRALYVGKQQGGNRVVVSPGRAATP